MEPGCPGSKYRKRGARLAKKLGFKKMYQDKDGFFMFGMSPADLKESK